MKPTQRESLSALADGALEPDALRFLLRGLENDPAALEAWERYHVAGEALRGNACGRVASADFALRVRAGLNQDAPARDTRHRWLQWSGGGVIAAGVAAAALMMVQPRATAPTTAPADVATAASARPAADSRAALASAPTSPAQVPRWLSASSATQMAQPAAATFYGFGNGVNTLAPATYSRRMAPYMHIHAMREGARSQHQNLRYVLLPPHRAAANHVMAPTSTR